jgi:hypothetical protein
MCMHVIDEWKSIPILLNLQNVVDGAIANNLAKKLIVWNLIDFKDLSVTNVGCKQDKVKNFFTLSKLQQVNYK